MAVSRKDVKNCVRCFMKAIDSKMLRQIATIKYGTIKLVSLALLGSVVTMVCVSTMKDIKNTCERDGKP